MGEVVGKDLGFLVDLVRHLRQVETSVVAAEPPAVVLVVAIAAAATVVERTAERKLAKRVSSPERYVVKKELEVLQGDP